MPKEAKRDPRSQKGKSSDDGKTQGRRPRGLGGVLLITLLLISLFVIVSRANQSQERSLYDFWRVLLNGRHKAVTIGDTKLSLTYEDGGGRTRLVEANYLDLKQEERDLIQDLAARRLDQSTYQKGGAEKFLQELQNGEVSVAKAWLVHDYPANEEATAALTDPKDRLVEDVYLTAILTRGDGEHYVRFDRGEGGGAPLAALVRELKSRGVAVSHFALNKTPNRFLVEERDTALLYVLSTVGPWILLIGLFWFFIIRQMRSPGGAGSVLSFGRSRATLYTKEHRTNLTFDDVAGVEEAKEEVQEIIEFLKNPGKFQRLGGRIPRGVLLVGSPGTGKTLLAKAIAGEAEVPFFSISGSDFVEMFVGVGASRVRDLFKQAKENSPCIIFLDEIDAVGRKRGSGLGGGHDEREQTLNAILVEMDGFDTDEGIILIGATNRPDVLDPALLRPGRFDRQIVIDMPDVEGREAILRVHARKVKLAADVDLKVIARATPSFSGADLAAVINESAIMAGMRRKEVVEMEDLEEARDRVKWGREKKSRRMEQEDRRVTAYHEAGHALVSALLPEVDPVHKVTIISRGMALGATMSLPERDDYHLRRSKLLGMISVAYGGRIAEAQVFGDISAGAQNDIQQATRMARMMVAELGMSESIGPVNYAVPQESSFLGKEFGLGKEHSEETARQIDGEVKNILIACYRRAEQLVSQNRDRLDAIAAALLEYDTLHGQEVMAIMRGDTVDEFRRAQKRSPAVKDAPRGAADRREEVAPEGDVGLSGAEGLA